MLIRCSLNLVSCCFALAGFSSKQIKTNDYGKNQKRIYGYNDDANIRGRYVSVILVKYSQVRCFTRWFNVFLCFFFPSRNRFNGEQTNPQLPVCKLLWFLARPSDSHRSLPDNKVKLFQFLCVSICSSVWFWLSHKKCNSG